MTGSCLQNRSDLILYATPTGPLAEECLLYFERAQAVGATAAQLYPPHCTLTGFFRRLPERRDQIVAETDRLLRRIGKVPGDAVTVAELRSGDEWVGLVLNSPWLLDLTRRFVDEHRLTDGDDPLRPKDWLHLSLAYGVENLRPYQRLATAGFNHDVAAGWTVGLWERSPDNAWTLLTDP